MRVWLAAAAVAALTAALYWGALSSGFVGDDVMILHRLHVGGSLLRFFRGEFFEYYRPLGFVAHAIDFRLAGADPRQFHLTNLLLHVASAILVLLIGRALSPKTLAGPIASLLFALHPSSHEAVIWISARFDLLATCGSLAAVWLMVRRDGRAWIAPALAFGAAVLGKEAAVALPIAAAGFAVFRVRAGMRETVLRLIPWLVVLALYSVARHAAGGVSTIGGATKLPKLAGFLVVLTALVLLAGPRGRAVQAWLAQRGRLAAGVFAAAVALLMLAAGLGHGSGIGADKLAVAGFMVFNLLSPVLSLAAVPFYLDPGTTRYWAGGAVALAVAGLLTASLWRRLRDDDRMWFLATFLLAALLPISALTEGTRYLYLPSAAVSLIAGILLAEAPPRRRAAAMTAMAVFLAISSWQILVKVRDWNWAGRLTGQGAALVDAALAPSCGEGRVVFLTEPVALRSVYTHFLYETFELPRGCQPGRFDILARMIRIDTPVDARWTGPRTIAITLPDYRGNLSVSSDGAAFGPPPRRPGPIRMRTPLGEVDGEADGTAERLTLTLAGGVDVAATHFYFYSGGRIQPLAK